MSVVVNFNYYILIIFMQVTVVHISATSKNAADDKLKQCMKRFVDTHGAPATLLLISGIMFLCDILFFLNIKLR